MPSYALRIRLATLAVSRSSQTFLIMLLAFALTAAAHATVTPSVTSINFGSISVGSDGTAKTITFTFSASTTLNSSTPVSYLTQGAPNLEFQAASGGTCTGTTYAAAATCTVRVNFIPAYPGQQTGAVVLENSSGVAVATVYLRGTGLGPQIGFTFGAPLTAVTGGMSDPRGIAVDGAGNVYIAEFGSNRVIKVTPGGVKTTIAMINGVDSLAMDGAGNLYGSYGDEANGGGIFEIPAGGVMTRLGGYGTDVGVALDGAGNLYFADSLNYQIGVVSLSPFGSNARFFSCPFAPSAIAADSSGNMYVVDNTDWLVWKVSPTGSSWNPLSANYNRPQGVTVDGLGHVYVADLGNNEVLNDNTPLPIQTSSFPATFINEPISVAVDGAGIVYIGELLGVGQSYGEVMKINRNTPPRVAFATYPVGWTSATPKQVIIDNIGNEALTFPVPPSGTNPSVSADFSFAGGMTCSVLTSTSTQASLAPGASCYYAVGFSPTVAGAITGSMNITDNSLNVANAMQSIPLSGTGKATSVTVKWTAPAAIPAGTALSTKQLDAQTSVAGKFVYSPAAGTKLAKGTHALTTTFTPTDKEKYLTTTAKVDLVVK